MRLSLLVVTAAALIVAESAQAAPIRIVAAEDFYGDIARQIGGDAVAVESILSNPGQDPHEFEASASVARKVAAAQIVIYNGAGYDAWMEKLLRAAPLPRRVTLHVAALARRKDGDNPHLWYDVAAIAAAAEALTRALAQADPAHAAGFQARGTAFSKSLDALKARVAALRGRYGGQPVTATEPVFGYMAEAMGLVMRNARFQLAVMNDTEPSPADVAAFEQDLRGRKVKLLIYNRQTHEGLSDRLRKIAQESNIPVVGVTETQPEGMTYQQWMTSQLDAVEQALGR